MSNKEEYKKYLLMRIGANNSSRNKNSSDDEPKDSAGDTDFSEPAPDIRESFRQVLDEIADNAHMLYGSSTVDGIAEFAAEDIAEYIDHVGQYIDEHTPYKSERELYERCKAFDDDGFAEHWELLHPYLTKRYQPEELNIPFYIDEFPTLAGEEYAATRLELLHDWDIALLRKEIAYELEILSRMRHALEKQIEDRIKSFYGCNYTALEVGLFWGLEKGDWMPSQIDLLRALAAVCHDNRSITTLLDALGRRGAQNKTVEIGLREVEKVSATQFRHASPPDIDGVTESNRLNGLLPSEMALLGDRSLELNFYKKYAEHRLQTFDSRSHIRIREQFEQPAISIEKKGPYIVCLDTSGSMCGKPEEVAKAICYGLLLRSREEGRKCYVISYSTDIEVLDLTEWDAGMNAIVDFLTFSFHGGTDLEPALAEAMRMLETEDYILADVLIVSDFEVGDLVPRTVSRIRDMQRRNVQFHSLLIGSHCNRDVVNKFDCNWRYDHNKNEIKATTIVTNRP